MRGFTFLEVLIALILIVIGISAAVAAVSTGRFFLKQAENKARAMRAALVGMEKYLAKSYSDLTPGENLDSSETIKLQVNVTQRYEGSARAIPYKQIEALAFYNETDKTGNIYQKIIRLTNIVPYPFIHAASVWISRDQAGDSEARYSSNPGNFAGAQVVGEDVKLALNLNYEVPKELLVIYNVATNVQDATGINSTDTIYTGCFVDDVGPKPVVSRTPIITQPLINNVVALTEGDALSPGNHTIAIKWCKDTAQGTILLREADLTVVAIEEANE